MYVLWENGDFYSNLFIKNDVELSVSGYRSVFYKDLLEFLQGRLCGQ